MSGKLTFCSSVLHNAFRSFNERAVNYCQVTYFHSIEYMKTKFIIIFMKVLATITAYFKIFFLNIF